MTRHGESGMTLVELLVGLALFGMIAAASLAALQGGVRLWQGAAARSEATMRIEAVHAALRRTLEGTVNLADAGTAGVAFAGDARQLAWVGRPPSGAMPAGLYALRLEVSDTRLIFGWRAFDPALPLAAQAPEEVSLLLDGIDGAVLSYFGTAAEDRAAWRETWRAARLPRLVRLSVTPAAGAAWRWPPLVVAIGAPLDGA
jgi:prepilin-type N-terminal cleavage/methylation domain-containing protein